MLNIKSLLLLLAITVFFQNVSADDDINAALQKTQECLKNQNCDSAKTAAGQAANQKALDAVAGDASNQQELYNIAADIMPFLIEQTGGDLEKLQALMLKAQNDPAGFLNSLPADIQAKIKNAAKAVEKK
jgi:hypothetical protein